MRPAVLGGTAVLVLLGVAAAASATALPPVVDPALDLSDSSGVLIAGHPLALAAQVVNALLYASAAVAFTRRAAASGDELFRWLGAGCALDLVLYGDAGGGGMRVAHAAARADGAAAGTEADGLRGGGAGGGGRGAPPGHIARR